jgi:hypothetical protein
VNTRTPKKQVREAGPVVHALTKPTEAPSPCRTKTEATRKPSEGRRGQAALVERMPADAGE